MCERNLFSKYKVPVMDHFVPNPARKQISEQGSFKTEFMLSTTEGINTQNLRLFLNTFSDLTAATLVMYTYVLYCMCWSCLAMSTLSHFRMSYIQFSGCPLLGEYVRCFTHED